MMGTRTFLRVPVALETSMMGTRTFTILPDGGMQLLATKLANMDVDGEMLG